MKVTITLTDKTWEALRVRAIKEKKSASAILDELAAEYLKRTGKGGKR